MDGKSAIEIIRRRFEKIDRRVDIPLQRGRSFKAFMTPNGIAEFRQTIQETSVEAVVTFNKGIFNLVSKDPIDRYIEHLMEGGLIQSQIQGVEKYIPIFLTFPTGWIYQKNYRQLRKASLDTIRTAICSVPNAAKGENT